MDFCETLKEVIGSLWGFTPDEVRPVAQPRSQTWAVMVDETRFYLKPHRFQHDADSIDWELRLLIELDERHCTPPVPQPLPTKQGNLFGMHADQCWTLFHAVPGEPVNIRQLDARFARQIGQALAQFHANTSKVKVSQRPKSGSILALELVRLPGDSLSKLADVARRTPARDPFQSTLLGNVQHIISDLYDLHHRLNDALDKWSFLPIHGDFTPRNLLVSRASEITGIIDFEFAHLDHRVSDIGRVADMRSELVGKSSPSPAQWALGIAEGYLTHTKLTEAELAAVPDFMRLHYVTGYLFVMEQWLFNGRYWDALRNHIKACAAQLPNYRQLCREADGLRARLVECQGHQAVASRKAH